MREDICSIPVSEVFEEKKGCPICRMYEKLEEHLVDYITGAAMMEPDVRIETNKSGFCHAHYREMLTRRNRLSVALTLESHTKQLGQLLEFGAKGPSKEQLAGLGQAAQGCFVCDKIEWGLVRLLTTVMLLWQKEEEFRALYAQQEGLCLPHAVKLLRQAGNEMHRRSFPAFAQATQQLVLKQLSPVTDDLSHYCKMYDYRNAGGDWGTSKDAVERAIACLTGKDPRENGK